MRPPIASTILILFLCVNTTKSIAQQKITTILKKELTNKRIVLLGEPSHAEGNVIAHKLELVKFLHDSLGYNILAFESGLYDVNTAYKLILQNTGKQARPFIEKAIFPHWYNSKDFQSFFSYYEKNKNSLRLTGFDNQFTGSYSQFDLINDIQQKLLTDTKERNIVKTKKILSIDFDILSAVAFELGETMTFPKDIKFSDFIKNMDILITTIKKSKSLRTDANGYLLALANMKVLAVDYYHNNSANLSKEEWNVENNNIRDSMMAINLIAISKQYPNEKIICWGAGAHFMNKTEALRNEELKLFKPMGMYLKKYFNNDVYNLNYTSSSGNIGRLGAMSAPILVPKDGSLEYTLKQQQSLECIIPLQKLPWRDSIFIASGLEPNEPLKENWSQIFDALIYLPAFTPNLPRSIEMNYDFEAKSKESPKKNFVASEKQKLLKKVKIQNKKFNIKKFVKKVQDNFHKNYTSIPYEQKVYTRQEVIYKDSTLYDIESVANFYPFIKLKSGVHNTNHFHTRRNTFKDPTEIPKRKQFMLLPRANSNWTMEPLGRLRKKLLLNYKFKFKNEYNDSIYGKVIELYYVQKRYIPLAGHDLFEKIIRGILSIREKDYAIVKHKKIIVEDIDKWNKIAIRYNKARNKNKRIKSTWSDVIYTKDIHTITNSYSKDSISNTYYISMSKSSRIQEGYQMGRPDETFVLKRENQTHALNLPKKIDEKSLNYTSFVPYFISPKFDKDFWANFEIPQ